LYIIHYSFKSIHTVFCVRLATDAIGLTVSDCEGVKLMVPPLVSPIFFFFLQKDSETESDLIETIWKNALNEPTLLILLRH
jgi:hypothetical protein